MDQDLWLSNFGQRKAKLTALQKLVTHNEKNTGKCKESQREKVRLKHEKKAAMKTVPISFKETKILKKNLGTKPSSFHRKISPLKKRKHLAKRLSLKAEVVEAAQSNGPRRVLFRPSDIPSMSQLNKLVTRSSATSRRDEGRGWSEGQMLWGKIGGYPFWPCMVSRDPFSKLFSKDVGSNKTSRSFHVQFFGGNAERSWISEASLVEYEGREKFVDIVQYGLKNPESCSRSPDDFKVSPDWFPAWSMAFAQAEVAFKLDLVARIQRYTFQYVIVKGKAEKPVDDLLKMVASKSKDHLKAKSDQSDSDDDNVNNLYNEVFTTRNDRPLYDSDDIYSSDESLSTSSEKPGKLPVKIVVRKGLLDVFLAKHTQFVQREHPDWKKSWIIDYLTRQWTHMSEHQRSRYTTRLTKQVYVSVSSKSTKQNPEIIDSHAEVDPHKLDLQITKLSRKCRASKSSQFCLLCEGQGSNLTSCKGPCGRYYHTSCLRKDSDDFMCSECSIEDSCFACRKPVHDPVLCSENCSKIYHKNCVTDWKEDEKDLAGIVCPLHVCATCAVDGSQSEGEGPLVQCGLCPTAFHASEFCVGAGSLVLGKGLMVCGAHFSPSRGNSQHSRVNVKFCLECGEGGSLLLCQTCPSAYHEDCVGRASQEEGNSKQPGLNSRPSCGLFQAEDKSWLCPPCQSGRKLLYGEIVWVKHGVYRWWPSEVCHPCYVPRNVQEKRHQVGEFPVRFFGSLDFAWIHSGRAISFGRGSKSFRNSLMTSTGDQVFTQAVQEAVVAARFCATVERICTFRSGDCGKIPTPCKISVQIVIFPSWS